MDNSDEDYRRQAAETLLPSSDLERAERAIAAIREMGSSRGVLRLREATSRTCGHLERVERAIAAIRDDLNLATN